LACFPIDAGSLNPYTLLLVLMYCPINVCSYFVARGDRTEFGMISCFWDRTLRSSPSVFKVQALHEFLLNQTLLKSPINVVHYIR